MPDGDPRYPARLGQREPRQPSDRHPVTPEADMSRYSRDTGAVDGQPNLSLEALARIAPDILRLHQRVERFARPHRGRRHRDEPVEVAAHDVERRRGLERRVELGAEGVDEEPPLAAALAEGLGPRARSPSAPVADGDVDAVARVERAVSHRDHEALEPGADLSA